jgi:sulfhydrogenase subunit delta
MKKARIGWFSFSCCEDSTILFTELMNTHFDEWKKILDIRAARVLRKNEEIKDLDISFVEGAVASERDAEKVKKIRKNSRILVAIGSCACDGMPSSQRNKFNEKQKKEIQNEVKKFKLLEKTLPLDKVVKVDEYVQGCPMDEKQFLKVLDRCVKRVG